MRLLLCRVFAALLILSGGQAHAAWQEAKSKHFIIYANDDPERLRTFAERLERFDQAVRYVRGMDDPPLTDSNRLRVYTLRSGGAVAKLAGMASARGFYHARASGAVAFVPRNEGSNFDIWDLDTEAIFFHEYAHHLQLQYAAIAIPEWVVEGFAEFYATAKINKDGSVLIGSPPMYRAWSLFNGTGLTIEQMVGGTYGKLNDAQRDLLYGRGWLLTHYLSFNKSRSGQLNRYIDGIQKGMSATESARAALGDLKTLNRELERYKSSDLVGVRVDAAKLSVGPIAVRPLNPAEAAIMDVHIRSTRGVDAKTAPGVAADARKAAAPYPNDPFVQAALAEAEYDAGNYPAAAAAADRALAANPANVHALIYKGRAEMALGAEHPDKADWLKVRSWFVKANKADTENAEPLMLFFQSYAAAGLRPTKNAIDGLLYAVMLAPQDYGLRMNAVHQLLIDERIGEAKDLFAPLAFQPHATPEWREATAKIMDAISAGDGKAALRLMDGSEKLAESEQKKP